MIIREALTDDAAGLAEVHVAAWKAAYKGLMPGSALNNLSVEQRTKDWQEWLTETNPVKTLVAEQDNRIIAFCAFGPAREDNNAVEIYVMNIHPDYWRQGYGRSLYEETVKQVQSKSITKILLWTLKTNTRSHQFYESLGFKADGKERTDSELTSTPLHEVRYIKELS